MKKILITLTILASSTMLVNAQPYKMGVGVTVGSIEGVNFKAFFGEHFNLNIDLGYKWWTAGSIAVNPNLAYQATIKDWSSCSLDWYAGGGLSAGYAIWWGGFYGGVNALAGLELNLSSVPLSFGFDFRPGFGFIAGGHYNYYGYTGYQGNRAFFPFFDWSVQLTGRYTFGN